MSPMRTLLLAVVIGCLSFAGNVGTAIAAEGGGMDAEVEGAVHAFLAAYAARDIDALMSQFSSRDDVMMYGTGADEKRIGAAAIRAQAERDWAQSSSAEVAVDWMQVSGSGNIAWVAMDGVIHVTAGEENVDISARVTMVFEKEKGSWKIAQAHFSTPASFQEDGESF